MSPSLRWIRADLRARRGQALLTIGVVAAVVTALITAATLLEDGTNPWRGLFTRSNGAHVWIHTQGDADPDAFAHLADIEAVAGPYRTVPATLVQGGSKSPVALRAMAQDLPATAGPLIREGRWLDPRVPEGVVLERSFARAVRLRVGDPLSIRGLNGATHDLTVAGIADSADQGFYPEWTPGLAWALPVTLTRVEPKADNTQSLMGLRLADPGATDIVVQRAVVALGGQVQRITTWREVRGGMELDNRLLGLLLALFGVVGLIAAGLAIANATGGRILTQLHDIAVLKATGFTRGQVTRMLLLQHAALGLLGLGLGVLASRLIVTFMLAETIAVPLSVGPLAAITLGTVVVVLMAALLPSWRGGRTPPIPAAPAAPPRGRLSRLTRLALLVRLPPPLVLGTRDAFTRKLYATLTTVGLAVPMMMITIGLGVWATLDDFQRHPERVGQAGALVVRAGSQVDDATVDLADRDVAAIYPGADVDALEPAQTRTVTARAIGSSAVPYPFTVVEGRMFRVRGEAVAGQGLLDLLHAKIGERVRLTIGGTPVNLKIVGRVIEPERDGEVVSFGLDSLDQKDATVEFYSLVLRPGADPDPVRARLQARGFDVHHVVNPAARLEIVRVIIVALVIVLALIGLANLLTASAVGLRDHQRDLGVLKAMGLTPRQVMGTLVTATGLLALIAVVGGVAAGAMLVGSLIDLQGRTSGVGAGIGRAPDALTLAVTVIVALSSAVLTALLPARRAARAKPLRVITA